MMTAFCRAAAATGLCIAIVASAAGCVAPRVGAQCALSSDCPSGLHCVAGTCRQPCGDDRDCTDGMLCVLEPVSGQRRCLSPSDGGGADADDANAPDTVRSCPAGSVLIPGGEYAIGADPADSEAATDERPTWTAVLSDFCMDRNEVTVAQFRQCRTAGRCLLDPRTTAPCNWGVAGREQHPVNCVEWNQASDYCAWSGGRLPTEAEWEGAAHGPTWRTYPWGNTPPASVLANFGNTNGMTQAVAAAGLDRCNSVFGLCDMAGNTWEWVNDWYAPYPTGRVTNPAGPASAPTPARRVYRGGTWSSGAPGLRTTDRSHDAPEAWSAFFGFRCARPAM